MFPDKFQVDPTYTKENGVWVLDLKNVLLPRYFHIKEMNIIYVPPGQTLGNHRHPRTEIFVGIGDNLELSWITKDRKVKHEPMHPDKSKIMLWKVPPFLPHAIRNTSATQFALLVEYANSSQSGVEEIKVIKSEPEQFVESD